MSGYIGVEPIPRASRVLTEGIFQSDTTTLTIPGGFDPGQIAVWIDGIKLRTNEFTGNPDGTIDFQDTIPGGTAYIVEEITAFQLPYLKYEEERIDLTGSGDFTGGEIICTRAGKLVTIMVAGNSGLEFPSGTSIASTDSGVIPENFRPNFSPLASGSGPQPYGQVTNIYAITPQGDSSPFDLVMEQIGITPAGGLSIELFDSSFAAYSSSADVSTYKATITFVREDD